MQICELVLEFGGSMSGEHGDGLARSYLNETLFGPELYAAFEEIKRAFDPENLMNPGKIVRGPSPIENLRMGARYQRLPVATTFDFGRQGSLAGAAELCNGSGVCRKLQTGTMCPSFMVTREEEHSTRGRANALRLVLSGGAAQGGIDRPADVRHLRLVPGLQGLQGRMPIERRRGQAEDGVPVALLQRARHAWGVRQMADAARLNRWGSALAPVSNWLAGLPLTGWLAEKLLKIDRRRPLPRFEREHFGRWFRGRPRVAVPARAGRSCCWTIA